MQETIITTLLKFNEIFDAFQQVFKIHNYNCNQQRELLESYLSKEHISSCIYISANSNNQIFPNYTDLEKVELQLNQKISQQQNSAQELISETVDSETKCLRKQIEEILLQHNQKLDDLKSFITDVFVTKSDIRSFKMTSDDKINKFQDQLQQFQTKYALKLYTEQHIIEIKQAIQTLQSTVQNVKQDSQTLHKLNRDMKSSQKENLDAITKRVTVLEQEQYRIEEFQKEIENMHNNIQEMKSENETVQNKVKALAQLFQELEVNNSKVVKFEIHTAFRKVEDELNFFKNRQQSFQDQLQVIKEQIQKQEADCAQFSITVNDQLDIISQDLVKKNNSIKVMMKHIALLQQMEKNQIQSDLPNKVSVMQVKLSQIERYMKSVFESMKKTIDVIQEFCETSQIPSEGKEKDLTNLILLLDRKMMDLGRNLNEQNQQTMQSTTVKIHTPRISTSIDSPYKINSQRKKINKFSKVLNQTMCYDRRDTIL